MPAPGRAAQRIGTLSAEPVPAPSHCQYAVLGLLHPGDIIMPATVVEAMPYPLSAIAIEPSPSSISRSPFCSMATACGNGTR